MIVRARLYLLANYWEVELGYKNGPVVDQSITIHYESSYGIVLRFRASRWWWTISLCDKWISPTLRTCSAMLNFYFTQLVVLTVVLVTRRTLGIDG